MSSRRLLGLLSVGTLLIGVSAGSVLPWSRAGRVPLATQASSAVAASAASAARLTPQVIEALLGEGVPQEGYEDYPHKDTAFGAHRIWDYQPPPRRPALRPNPRYSAKEPYLTHMTGFRRGTLFGPDDIGRLFREHHITFSDGLGDGQLESMMINKKYGLRPFFYAPDGRGVAPPFLKTELPAFRRAYAEECAYMAEWVNRLSGLYGQPFVKQPGQLWSLQVFYNHAPFQFFLRRARENFEAVNAEFRAEHGFDLPLQEKLATPQEQAQRIAFWHWVRRKYGEVGLLQSEEFRRALVGPGWVTGNIHSSDQEDYELWGRIFDFPGISTRPNMLDRPLGWRYYLGYITRLIADLTHKPPLIAVRVNLLGSGSRVVPTPSAQKYWYAQVAQNGARGLMEWVWDYPADLRDPRAYSGPNVANPDGSALGKLRWETMLYANRVLGETNRFVPPDAETAVFVSLDTCALKGWKRVFSGYVELAQAHVWHQFLSDQGVRQGTAGLSRFKVVYVPVMRFAHRRVLEAMERYVREGGTLISVDPNIFSYDERGEDASDFRRRVFGVKRITPAAGQPRMITARLDSAEVPIGLFSEAFTIETEPDGNLTVLARYPDGSPAVVERQLGRGRAIFSAANLMDLYEQAPEATESGRGRFYKWIEQRAGIADQSWVWDLAIEDIAEITGRAERKYPPVDKSVRFRNFMYGHGEPTVEEFLRPDKE